jgi:hypothetical protein
MFKRLQPTDYVVTPFKANKLWRFSVDPIQRESSPYLDFHAGANLDGYFFEDRDPRNKTGTYLRAVYSSIRHLYYREDSTIYENWGVENVRNVDLSTFPRDPFSIVYVLKISNQIFGERILPGTLKISTELEGEKVTLVDDSNGNLIIEETRNVPGGQQTQLGDPGYVVGNVFYQNGVLVLTRRPGRDFKLPDFTTWPNYTFEEVLWEGVDDASTFPDYELSIYDQIFRGFDLEFRGEVTHYENEVRCVINPDEFNGVTNPTIFARKDNGDVVENKDEFIDFYGSEEFSPFITQVGLYDEFLNLVAIGKLARPLKKPQETPLTLVVRFDT